MKLTLLNLAGVLGTGLILSASSIFAQSVYTDGHGDLGVEYTPGETEFEPHWHIGAGGIVDGNLLANQEEFAPDELVARLGTTSSVSNSDVADALGVTTGYTAYRTGITAYPPNLGFGLEEVGAPGEWLGGAITLSLHGFSGLGEMAISQTISGIGTLVWFSSQGDNYTVADNNWEFAVGGHQHNDWWFTEVGDYEVEFTWTGTYVGVGGPIDVSGAGTFGFEVVPEPGTWGLLATGLTLLIVMRRRRLPA